MVQHTLVLQPGDTLTVSCAKNSSVGGKRKSRRNNSMNDGEAIMNNNNNNNENNNNTNNNTDNDNNNINTIVNENVVEFPMENTNTNLTDEEITMATLSGGKRKTRSGKSRKATRKANKTRKQSGGKKGPNGYMKFAAEVRPQILKEHPELKSDVVKVARKIGEKWRALSDSEKSKY